MELVISREEKCLPRTSKALTAPLANHQNHLFHTLLIWFPFFSSSKSKCLASFTPLLRFPLICLLTKTCTLTSNNSFPKFPNLFWVRFPSPFCSVQCNASLHHLFSQLVYVPPPPNLSLPPGRNYFTAKSVNFIFSSILPPKKTNAKSLLKQFLLAKSFLGQICLFPESRSVLPAEPILKLHVSQAAFRNPNTFLCIFSKSPKNDI